MAEPILDREEIEALTAELGAEERAAALFATLPPVPQPEQVEPFAFSGDAADDPQRYPLLLNLHERLAEALRDHFGELFGREAGIEQQAMTTRRYAEVIRRERPALWIVLEDAELGRLLAWADLALVVAAVDAMLAGSGEVDDEPEQLTEVERRLARHLATQLCEELMAAWRPVRALALAVQRMDTDPQFLAAASPDEVCFVAAYALDAGERSRGEIGLAYPKGWLEPLLDRLRAPIGGEEAEAADPAWRAALLGALGDAPAPLALEIGRLRLTVGEFLALKPGDELPLPVRRDDPGLLVVRGAAVARARPGASGGRLVAEVVELLDGRGGER